MVRASGPGRTQVPPQLLRVAGVIDHLDSSGEASHALCRICDKYTVGPDSPGHHIDCPVCLLHVHR
eukprot:10320179-Alexandrium_andersonii.AAC.1